MIENTSVSNEINWFIEDKNSIDQNSGITIKSIFNELFGIQEVKAHPVNKITASVIASADWDCEYKVYTTQTVRERKDEVKKELRDTAISIDGFENERCNELKAMPEEAIIQIAVDFADNTVPSVLNNNLPTLWTGPNVIGIIKHTFAKNYIDYYNEICQDKRIETEVLYKPNKERWKPKDPLKGTKRFDAIVLKREPVKIFDYKFGNTGITNSEYRQMINNAPPGSLIIEVRPSTTATPSQRMINNWTNK